MVPLKVLIGTSVVLYSISLICVNILLTKLNEMVVFLSIGFGAFIFLFFPHPCSWFSHRTKYSYGGRFVLGNHFDYPTPIAFTVMSKFAYIFSQLKKYKVR